MCGEVTFLVVLNKRCWIKFVYSEKKGTNFWEISTIDLSDVVTVKSTVEISQNFVAFSEYMNFNLPNILSNYIHISIFIGFLAMKKKLDTSNVSFTWLLHWNLITITLNIQIKIASFMQSQRSDKQAGQPPLLVKVIRWLPRQRYTYRVLQTIQMKLILLCGWAELAVLGSKKTALKFKYEI